MRPIAIAALAIYNLPLSALADGMNYTPPRPPGPVTVYRGSSANVPSPVAVYRGSSVQPGYLATQPAPAPVTAVGGERIWFVDPDSGELTGCRLVSTYTVGVNRVRCTTADLPVD
ncbi:MAG: hypothetical protein ACJ8H8_10815 [Geminicoccaceae bacterium]